MRFLVDANLSPVVAERLRAFGHDARHVVDVGLVVAPDPVILEYAAAHGSVIVSADADFGRLLAVGGHSLPSVVLLRSADHLTPPEQAAAVVAGLTQVREDLAAGAIVKIARGRIRVRRLPVAG